MNRQAVKYSAKNELKIENFGYFYFYFYDSHIGM